MKKIGLLLSVILLFIFYLFLNDIAEQNKYKKLPSDWYRAALYHSSCARIDTAYIEIDLQKKETTTHVAYYANCSRNLIFTIYQNNITGYRHDINQSSIMLVNQTNTNIQIHLKPELSSYGQFELHTTNNFDYYSYYSMQWPKAQVQLFHFIFDHTRYSCLDCVHLIEGSITKEEPIFYREGKRSVKTYRFDNQEKVLLRFNPEKKSVTIFQKALDGIFFGIMATIFYVIWFSYQKKSK